MSAQLLQINYHYTGSRADFERAFAPAAEPIAHVAGLRWKIWIFNEAESRGGGIYLFDDETALHDYLNGPIVASIKTHPAFRDISVQAFDVLVEPTAITRGPVER